MRIKQLRGQKTPADKSRPEVRSINDQLKVVKYHQESLSRVQRPWFES